MSATEVGMVVGTPLYMPPEQLMSEGVDARCDLYAAGVVLYECLTGQLPYSAKSTVQLIAQVLHHEPAPPAQLNPGIPPALSQLVIDLLAKEREDRVASADLLVERLRGIE
jgi:serine/threonine-protein kinase